MDSGVYEIVNMGNGKRYVGSAKTFCQRFSEHRSQLRRGKHHNKHLQSSWTKHGEQAFRFTPILICAPANLVMYEQIAIDTMLPEYNLARVAGNTLGTKRSAETRAKIAEKAKGRKFPPRSAEYRAKISAAHRGRMPSAEHMAALQAGRQAREFSQEERQAKSETLRRQWADGTRSRVKLEQTKALLSQAFSKLTAEHVREMRRLHAAGVAGVELSRRFETPKSTVSQIVRGLRYRWVE
jgi:group I intron endonuclease